MIPHFEKTATVQPTFELRAEAALCLWECMLEARERPGLLAFKSRWLAIGTAQMRHYAIALADIALETYDLLGGSDGIEALDLIPYDWEFIPAFFHQVEWTVDGPGVDPATAAARIAVNSAKRNVPGGR